MTKHILVIDDEVAIRDMLRLALELEGFRVSDAGNVHQAINIIEQENIALILLDWMMPGVTGIEFAQRLRRENKTPNLGIIMLTAKDAEQDLIRGLESGADDYVSKPFSIGELISRINALLRRIEGGSSNKQKNYSAGKITIDGVQHKVFINKVQINLSPTEFRLLRFFIRNQNRVFDRDQLLDQVWGESNYVEDRTVDVHIRRLRKILEPHDCDKYVQTVRGVGYRFSLEN